MKKIKVWGGNTVHAKYGLKTNNQTRFIVAAYTKKEAIIISECSPSFFKTYCIETHNAQELKIANKPGLWIYDSSEEENKSVVQVKRI